jgi:predicted DNA-binding protein (UPF0251 family)
MPRPRKFRNIGCGRPGITRFVPVNGTGQGPASVLELEELEAIRLKDIECLDQVACAQCMQISRPTFQRILLSARQKIAIALVEGREIVINPEYKFDVVFDRTGPSQRAGGQRGNGAGHGCGMGGGPGRFGR